MRNSNGIDEHFVILQHIIRRVSVTQVLAMALLVVLHIICLGHSTPDTQPCLPRCAALVVSPCWLLVQLGNPVLQSRLTPGCDPVSGRPLASPSVCFHCLVVLGGSWN